MVESKGSPSHLEDKDQRQEPNKCRCAETLHKTSQPVSVRMLRGAAKVVLTIKSPIFLMCLLGSLAQQRSLGKAVIFKAADLLSE